MMDYIDDLEDEQEVSEGFTIDNDNMAEWALRKIAAMHRDIARYTAACQREIDYYTDKLEKKKKKYENDRGFFISLLNKYFNNIPTESKHTTPTQSKYELPSGTLIMKFGKEQIKRPADDTALIERFNGTAYVVQKPILQWGELKKTLKIDNGRVVSEIGEIIEDVEIEIKPASFDVGV